MKSTKYRTSPLRVRTSTLKKSVAAIAPQCALRNVDHDSPLFRSGAGSIPLSRPI